MDNYVVVKSSNGLRCGKASLINIYSSGSVFDIMVKFEGYKTEVKVGECLSEESARVIVNTFSDILRGGESEYDCIDITKIKECSSLS